MSPAGVTAAVPLTVPLTVTVTAFVLPKGCAGDGILAVMRKRLRTHGSLPRTRACPAPPVPPAQRVTLWLTLLVAALSPHAASGQAFVLEIQAPPEIGRAHV